MRKTIIALLLLGTLSARAQTKAKDTTKINQDSVNTVTVAAGIYQFAHDKNLGVKDFEMLTNILQAYIDERKKSWKK
jgi:hypothetical protein